MPVSHVGLTTGSKHYKEMRDFYVTILAPLGYQVFMEEAGTYLGLAPKHGAPDFWLHGSPGESEKFQGDVEKRSGGAHVAFDAKSRQAVDAWYKVAM